MLRCPSYLAICAAGMLGFVSAADPAPAEKLKPLLETFVQEFVEIKPGEGKFPKAFSMGSDSGETSEQPVHGVKFGYSFAIAKYEVPQNLYEAVLGENPSKWKGPRNSVEMMTFPEAVNFCDKLTRSLHAQRLIDEDEVIRLPTEAEWEYCCRAGTKTAYSFGDDARKPDERGNSASILNEYGWHTGNAAGNDPPVGAKKPNPWGLYDMHGYLWEFVLDDWNADYEHASADGSPAKIENDDGVPPRATIRGGSWKDRYSELRSAARRSLPRDRADDAVGLRCVKARAAKTP